MVVYYLVRRLGRRIGGPSGTSLIGTLVAAQQIVTTGEKGSLMMILCDGGERYVTTYYNPVRLVRQGYMLGPPVETLATCVGRGVALSDRLPVVGSWRSGYASPTSCRDWRYRDRDQLAAEPRVESPEPFTGGGGARTSVNHRRR